MPDRHAPDDVVGEQSRPQFVESVTPTVVGDDDPELDPPPGSSDACWTWSVSQRVGGLALAVAGGALYLLFVANTWPVWIGILGVAFVVWGLGLAATSGPTHAESATH